MFLQAVVVDGLRHKGVDGEGDLWEVDVPLEVEQTHLQLGDLLHVDGHLIPVPEYKVVEASAFNHSRRNYFHFQSKEPTSNQCFPTETGAVRSHSLPLEPEPGPSNRHGSRLWFNQNWSSRQYFFLWST